MPIKIWRRGGSAESRKVSAGHDLLPQACDGETRRSHLRSAQVSPRKVGAKAECRGVRNGSRGRTKFRPSRSQRAVQSPQKKSQSRVDTAWSYMRSIVDSVVCVLALVLVVVVVVFGWKRRSVNDVQGTGICKACRRSG
jgi:hypothetical protein